MVACVHGAYHDRPPPSAPRPDGFTPSPDAARRPHGAGTPWPWRSTHATTTPSPTRSGSSTPGSTCWTATGARSSRARTRRTRYLETHSWDDYAAWHLGLTEGATDETKARYAFVYGDFRRVHRTGLIACVYRASEWRHKDVELAAHDLLQRLDAMAGITAG